MTARDHLNRHVRAVVEQVLETAPSGSPVAFDADGTLWRGDIGEDLLRYLATHDLLPNHRGRRGVYEEYERRLHHVDPANAFAYAVEVMAGMNADELQALCDRFFKDRFHGRVFPYAHALIEQLQRRGLQLWIVSASPLWPVLSGAKALGISTDNVIAVTCELDAEGAITKDVKLPVPCGDGKVHGLKAHNVRPVLAFGNGDLDEPMLTYSEHAVVVAPPSGDNRLTQAAQDRGWPIQRC